MHTQNKNDVKQHAMHTCTEQYHTNIYSNEKKGKVYRTLTWVWQKNGIKSESLAKKKKMHHSTIFQLLHCPIRRAFITVL